MLVNGFEIGVWVAALIVVVAALAVSALDRRLKRMSPAKPAKPVQASDDAIKIAPRPPGQHSPAVEPVAPPRLDDGTITCGKCRCRLHAHGLQHVQCCDTRWDRGDDNA